MLDNVVRGLDPIQNLPVILPFQFRMILMDVDAFAFCEVLAVHRNREHID